MAAWPPLHPQNVTSLARDRRGLLTGRNGSLSNSCHRAEIIGYLARGHTALGDFVTAQKPFVGLKEALNQSLCSLPTSDMLDIVSNFMVKASHTVYCTSVAGTRKW